MPGGELELALLTAGMNSAAPAESFSATDPGDLKPGARVGIYSHASADSSWRLGAEEKGDGRTTGGSHMPRWEGQGPAPHGLV